MFDVQIQRTEMPYVSLLGLGGFAQTAVRSVDIYISHLDLIIVNYVHIYILTISLSFSCNFPRSQTD